MINKDLSEYPDHRVGFFKLIRAINQFCFPGKTCTETLFGVDALYTDILSFVALLTIPPAQFKLIIDSIVWAFKHTMREIADVGLNICLELIENISRSDTNVANFFYQQYLLNLVQDVFFVLTDTDHKSGMNNYLYNGYIQFNLFMDYAFKNSARIQISGYGSRADFPHC